MNESPAARDVLAYLSDPRHYRGHPRSVQVLETHFAWVFLADRQVFKLKKPTRQTSMDYSTLAARERGCRNEVRLNRRLAPDVYLGVVPIGRTREGCVTLGRPLGRNPVILDWLVAMRRLPADRMLDHAIRAGRVKPSDLRRITRRIVRFFRRARPRPMSGRAYLTRLRSQILENTAELGARDLGLSRRAVERVSRSQLRFVAAAAPELAGRGARLIDGHGDLRPEHVCLGARGTEACVIDCLEFEPDLRRLDPAEEIAFLALECERLGARELARALIERYRAAASDSVADALVHFYMSRRAATRAKIAAWHLRDEEFASEHRAWRTLASSYLADALGHIRSAQRALEASAASRAIRRGSFARLGRAIESANGSSRRERPLELRASRSSSSCVDVIL